MPRLPDAAACTEIHTDRRAQALRATGAGALAATAALAWAGAMRPDILPVDARAGGTAALAIALACLAAAGLLATAGREVRAAATPSVGTPSQPTAQPRAGRGGSEHAGPPMRAGVDELAEAIGAARISRILVVDASGGAVAEAAALARRLAAADEPAILADFASGRTAAALCSVRPTATIADIVGDPTTFAHGIHRDRSGRAHVMATAPGPGDAAAAASMTSALATLEEVYARTVAIVPSGLAGLDGLVHADTAIVVADGAGEDAALAYLAGCGVADAIVLTADAARRPTKGPELVA